METKSKFTAQGRTKLVSGSILRPELAGLRLIVVPCSETGKPETQLHKLLDRKWQTVVRDLKGWFAHHIDFKLGSISTSAVQSDVWAVHMLCYNKKGELDVKALQTCCQKIASLAVSEKASIHMWAPYLNEMPTLQELVAPTFLDKGIHCYFYTDEQDKIIKEPQEPQVVGSKIKSRTKKTTPPVKSDIDLLDTSKENGTK